MAEAEAEAELQNLLSRLESDTETNAEWLNSAVISIGLQRV